MRIAVNWSWRLWLLGTLLLAAAQQAMGAEVKSINVRDFGAVGDGVANDGAAINLAIAEGVKRGPGTTVFVPKGRYLLNSQGGSHLLIDHAQGLTFRGEPGAVLIAQNPDAQIVRLAHCTGTTVQALSLQQQKNYFVQGVVDTIGPDGKSCDVTIDKGYDAHDTIHRSFTPQCPIRIGNADRVVIRSNTFSDPVTASKPVRVLIEKSGVVSLEGNVNLPDSAVVRR